MRMREELEFTDAIQNPPKRRMTIDHEYPGTGRSARMSNPGYFMRNPEDSISEELDAMYEDAQEDGILEFADMHYEELIEDGYSEEEAIEATRKDLLLDIDPFGGQ